MFKLTIRSQAQQQQLILTKLLSYGSWINTIFHKLIKSVNSADIKLIKPGIPHMEIEILGRFYRTRYLLLAQ